MRRLKPDGGESLYRQARGAGRQVCPLQCCVGQKALGQVCPHPSGLLERSLAIEFMGPQKEPCVVGRGGREMLRKSDQCANHKGTPQLNLGLLQPYSLAVPPAWHPRKPLPSPPPPDGPWHLWQWPHGLPGVKQDVWLLEPLGRRMGFSWCVLA